MLPLNAVVSLLYLGVSLPNNHYNPLASKLKFIDAQELNQVKISHDEYAFLLDSLKSLPYVKELTLISTCNRFELILFTENIGPQEIEEINRNIKAINKSEIKLEPLFDQDAKYHILRTFCGLNSGLIGESEIFHQIEISFKQCFHMGYLGKEGMQLFYEAAELRKQIDNNFFTKPVSYCDVALKSALGKFANASFNQVVVLGSGNTAHKACLALVKHGIKNILLIHRISSSSNQIAAIKASVRLASMKYQRAKYGYHSPKVKDLVMSADLLISTIDTRIPVLDFTKGYKVKIIDFNSKPSCTF